MTDSILIKGPVLGPGWIGRPAMGLTDRPLTPSEIQKAAHGFLPGTPIVDVQHDLKKQAEVVESFITSNDYQFNGQTYPPGTWFVTSKVTDPTLIKGIQDGTFKGYSVGAWPEEYRDRLVAKGLFSDVKEGEWFALAVSIAKLPFYPEAIFKVFQPDEVIKKNIPDMEVDKLTEEDKGIGSAFNKLLDFVINKEAKAEDVKTIAEATKGQQFVTEEMLDNKLDAHYKKMEELVKEAKPKEDEKDDDKSDDDEEDKKEDKEAKKDSKDSKSKDKKEKAKDTKEEDKEEDDESEDGSKDDGDDTMISKAIKIDDAKQGKKGKTTFMEECGLDPQGRNPDYL